MTAAPWHRRRGDGLELRVLVKARCRDEGIGEPAGDAVAVRVNAPPVEGRANRRVIEVVAAAFGVAKSRVQLIKGARSPSKWVRIDRPARFPPSLESALKQAFEVDQYRKDG